MKDILIKWIWFLASLILAIISTFNWLENPSFGGWFLAGVMTFPFLWWIRLFHDTVDDLKFFGLLFLSTVGGVAIMTQIIFVLPLIGIVFGLGWIGWKGIIRITKTKLFLFFLAANFALVGERILTEENENK